MSNDACKRWLMCKADIDALAELRDALWAIVGYPKSGEDLRNLGSAILLLEQLARDFTIQNSAYICADLRQKEHDGNGFELCITPERISFNQYRVGWICPVQGHDGADSEPEVILTHHGGFDVPQIEDLVSTLLWMDCNDQFALPNEKKFFSNNLGYPI